MKTKSKIIAGAILAIVLCVSLIAGATFALFTSESSVDISVTAGTVDVSAVVDKTSFYTKQLNKDYIAGLTNTQSQDVKVDDHSVAINGIMPGDGVKFDIAVTNNSNPKAVKYRTVLSGVRDEGLFRALSVKIGAGAIYDGSTVYSAWTVMSVPEETVTVEIVLPDSAGSECMGKACSLTYSVEAIQGNADTTDGVAYIGEGDARKDYLTLQAAFDEAKKGDTVYVTEDITLVKEAVVSNTDTLKQLTLDGQGHTVTLNCLSYGIRFGTTNNSSYCGEISVKNLTVTGSAYAAIFFRGSAQMCSLENVNISGEYEHSAVAVFSSCGANVVNCNITNSKDVADTIYATYGATNALGIFVNRNTILGGQTEEGGIALNLVNSTVDTIWTNNSNTKFTQPKVFIDKDSSVGLIIDPSEDMDNIVVSNSGTLGSHIGLMSVQGIVGFYRDMLQTEIPTFFITDAKGLRCFADVVNGTNGYEEYSRDFKGCVVRLDADIDLENVPFTPIGTAERPFLGTFDGNGKTISNLTIGSSETKIVDRIEYAGLFGHIGYTGKLNKHDVYGVGRNLVDRTKSVRATVKNLNLKNVTVYAQVAGSVVGFCNTSTVQNVTVADAVLDGGHYVGGIGGYVICESVIDGCTVTRGNFKASLYEAALAQDETDGWDKGDKVGGIVGLLQGSTVTNCTAIDIDICGYRDIGGIVGICNDGNAWKIGGGLPYNEDPAYAADPKYKTEDSYHSLGCVVTNNSAENIRLTFNNERIDADNAHANAAAILGRNNSSLNGRVKDPFDHAVAEEDNNTFENVTLPQ